jgi:hypothetical protein
MPAPSVPGPTGRTDPGRSDAATAPTTSGCGDDSAVISDLLWP